MLTMMIGIMRQVSSPPRQGFPTYPLHSTQSSTYSSMPPQIKHKKGEGNGDLSQETSPQPSLQICGEQIEFVGSFKLRGVIVTNNLSWTPHIFVLNL